MSAEPDLPRGLILEAVRSEYGVDVASIMFLEDGTAHAYRLEGPSGRFFLKLLPNTPYGVLATARVRAELPLLHALRGQGILTRVPRVVPTPSGADMTEIAGHSTALYEWIDAVNLRGDWQAALPELAPLLGRLHAGTPQLMALVPALPTPPEDFALPFEEELLDDLQALRQADQTSRLTALRHVLLPREAEVVHLLERTRTLQEAARNAPPEFVVCHTDAHGGNVMRDSAGELWLIDWETARLAPPEHDLWMLGALLWAVLPAYEAGLGRRVALNPAVLGFYVCRRVLEDLAVDVACIMRENARPEQDANNLMVIQEYILPALDRVRADLAALRVR